MADSAPNSWINKGSNAVPEWIASRMVGRRDPNGSFLIHARVGSDKLQARVAPGNIVIEHEGGLHTCVASEAKEMIAQLRREISPLPPRDAHSHGERRQERDVADMRDDTDDISRRINAASRQPAPLKPLDPAGSEEKLGQTPAGSKSSSAGRQRPPAAPSKKPAASSARKQAYPPPKGRRPIIEWIPLDLLSMDASYQRSTDNHASQRLIASIAQNFDWRLCTPLVVSRRGEDDFVVIDGQHRTLGARMRGLPDLPCVVFTYDSPEEEAKMFIAANRSRKPMNRLDDYFAALAAGDDQALEIQRVVTEAGFAIARNTSSSAWKPGEIAFTSSIASVLRKHGTEIVKRALTHLAEAFPDQKVVQAGSIFLGIVKLLVRPPEGFDEDRMFRALLKYDAEGWGSFVQGLKGGDMRATAIRDALLMAYEEVELEYTGDEAFIAQELGDAQKALLIGEIHELRPQAHAQLKGHLKRKGLISDSGELTPLGVAVRNEIKCSDGGPGEAA